MAVTTIEIDGKQVAFRASADMPRFYLFKFGRDIFSDFEQINMAMDKSKAGSASLDIKSLMLFEDIAYTMARLADKSIPDSVDDWLDGFNTFSIYQILPELIGLWNANTATRAESKKKSGPPTAQ